MNKTQYKELNREYLALKATEPGVENIGGVLVKRLADGSGERTASLSSIVVCRYSGNLIDGTQFDSNENDAMPYPFRVRELIEGWLCGFLILTYKMERLCTKRMVGNIEAIMDSLADSKVLWRQRIAMVSTWKTTQQGNYEYALRYAERLVGHEHDLMHKAVGWMLREVGKRGGMDYLEEFLDRHAATMPRTALRYAIEQMPEDRRHYYMKK